jgi:hypothetical protein
MKPAPQKRFRTATTATTFFARPFTLRSADGSRIEPPQAGFLPNRDTKVPRRVQNLMTRR